MPGVTILVLGFGLHGFDDVHAFDDLAKDDVLVVQEAGLDGADEELGAVGVGASVGHGQNSGAGVLELEVLVFKLLSIDGFAPSAIAFGEISTLTHKVLDDLIETKN